MSTPMDPQVSDSRKTLNDKLLSLIDTNKENVILEAGCGSTSRITLPDNAHLVGIDLSIEQLDRNISLAEKIHGDLESYNFGANRFDLIVCWEVLEHLNKPNNAVSSFVQSLKPNGVILIALPNLFSLKGFITKFSPHWFHVWVYRHIFGNSDAGKPGNPPFQTFLRQEIGPQTLKKFLQDQGMIIQYFHLYESMWIPNLKSKSIVAYTIYKSTIVLIRLLTLGLFDPSKTDYYLVCQAPDIKRED